MKDDLTPAEGGGRLPLQRDPLVLLAGLVLVYGGGAALYLAGVPLHPVQQITAAAFVLLCLAAVTLAPLNGLILLSLVPPLFNGEDNRPYFFLLEMLVDLTVLAGSLRLLARREGPAVRGGPFVLLFCVSAVASVPLNLNEMWLELQVSPLRQVVEEVRRGEINGNLFYVRTVLNVVSGAALYVLAAKARWTREGVIRLASAVTLLGLIVIVVGVWLHGRPPSQPAHYLTIAHGWGTSQTGFAGLGFNVSYFAQYALTYLPLAVLPLMESTAMWARGVAALVLLLTPVAVIYTGQRGAVLVFAFQMMLLMWMGLASRTVTGRSSRRLIVGVVGCGLATATAALCVSPLASHLLARYRVLWEQGDSYRRQALSAGWRMFQDHPVLGIGSGRFARVFADYDPDPSMQYGSLSAHNLYAQILAEQGLLGLLTFAALLAVTIAPLVGAGRNLGGDRAPVRLLLISLVSWLAYGLLQYTVLMRSMQVYFWITLGLLVSLAPDPAPATRPRRSWLWAALAVFLVLAGLRVTAALQTPLRPGLAVGAYALEPGNVRWTQGGAAFVLRVEGPRLRLPVACPLVPVLGRPQTVDVWVDDVPAGHAVLDTADWRLLEMPVSKPVGSVLVLRLRTGYTAIPASLGINADARRLGVLTQPVQWLPV